MLPRYTTRKLRKFRLSSGMIRDLREKWRRSRSSIERAQAILRTLRTLCTRECLAPSYILTFSIGVLSIPVRECPSNFSEGSKKTVNASSMFRAMSLIFLFLAGPGECWVREKYSLQNKRSSLIVKLVNSYRIGTLELTR